MRQRRRRWLAWFPGWATLGRALRQGGGLEWFALTALIVVFLGVGAIWINTVTQGWDGLRAAAGPHGTMTVRQCQLNNGRKDPMAFVTNRWRCQGSFAGSGVRIASVEVDLYADEQPGPTLAGRVSGPDATTVWADRKYELPVVVVLAVGLPVALCWIARLTVDMLEPLDGWPKPQRPPRDPTRPAQMGNRARRRRRRYRRVS
jgi:hypothetical protein